MKVESPSVIYNEIGQRVAKARKAQGISQEKLAAISNLDRSHIGFIEQGRRKPTLTTLIKLSQALQISLEQFFKGL